MGQLDGKVAVITGALGGMGRVACARFCEEGATVVGADRVTDGAAELEAELRGRGLSFAFRPLDVASADEVRAFAAQVAAEHDGVHVLYNNAGVNLGKPLTETSDEEWDRVVAINVTSVFWLTRAFAPLFVPGASSVINVSSVAALVAFENSCAYNTSKAAVAMLSKSAAVDLGPGTRVNAICPGIIETPMPLSLLESLPDGEAVWEQWRAGSELGRVGQPEEVVALALFLASDQSSFMTGAVIPVDGGWNLR